MNKETLLTSKGKRLAYILRHDKKSFNNGLIDECGWMAVNTLIGSFNYKKEELVQIVETDNKGRYEFNEDSTKIRARQGHSIPVDVGLTEMTPPDVPYHGTADRFVSSIFENGIVKGTRLYVHLSDNVETATKVGSRHGTCVVLKVDTKKMYEDGYKFFLSNNSVWLTDYVPVKYINKI